LTREPQPGQVYVNGKFCAQRTTGVQRYARSVLAALDAGLAQAPDGRRWTLLVPEGADVPALHAIRVRTLPWRGPGGLHGWEQLALPWAARHGRLLCLAGSAPAWAARPACVLHDAAVFDQPQAYSAAFRLWYRWLFRRLAGRARPVMTISEFSRQQLSRALHVPPQRLDLVPGGADHLRPVSPAPLPASLHGRRFLLAVGSANPTKNLPRLVRAWHSLRRDDACLVIAGGANGRVFAGPGQHPAGAGVVTLAEVDDALLVALYGAADALVFPSLYEGFGLPPLEAMAAGCPVAAAQAASLPEVCGDAALFFDPLDETSIAAALARLLDEPGLRDSLRERGRAHAAAMGWDRAAQRLRRLLDAVWGAAA
jgi:glycosyltransferase involved in cell wall biosynthesis